MPFVGDVVLRQVTPSTFAVEEQVLYHGTHEYFTVPRGMVTDLASVPWWLCWLVPRYGKYTLAALLHDLLCVQAARGCFSRHDADGLFRRCLRELGVGVLQRWSMYAAVRAASRWSDATARELAMLLPVTLLAVLVLAVPCLSVVVWGYGLKLISRAADYGYRMVTK